MQAKTEKINNNNIYIENKCNKGDFNNIIKQFFHDNYLYLMQKYFIYRLISEGCQPLLDDIENIVNKTCQNLSNEPNYYTTIYNEKIDLLIKILNEFLNSNSYDGQLDNEEDEENDRKNNLREYNNNYDRKKNLSIIIINFLIKEKIIIIMIEKKT